MRLKEREKREEEDREEDKEKAKQAQDAATIESNAVAKVTALFEARELVKPTVGQIACDSAEEVYKTALKSLNQDFTGINTVEGLKNIYLAASHKPSAGIAQDSAPSVMSTGLKAFTQHIRG